MNPPPSRPRSRRATVAKRAAVTAATLSLAAGAIVAGSVGAVAAPARHSYPGSVPSFVSAKNDAGAAADTTVEGEVYLALKDQTGAEQLATAVSTPGNPRYHRYISPAKWISRFAPSTADFNAVKQYLVNSGQTIYATPASREYIVFRGPASAVPVGFGTSLHDYRVAGTVVTAPRSAPSLPGSIASKVTGISLGNARAVLARHDTAAAEGNTPTTAPKTAARSKVVGSQRSAAATPPPTCSTYWNQYSVTVPRAYGKTSVPLIPCGYLPDQLQTSANLSKSLTSGNDGTGQTIAIVDWYPAPTLLSDTNTYMRTVQEPLLRKYTYWKPKQNYNEFDVCGAENSSQAEDAIDVQSSHSVAPGAGILFDSAFNCGGGVDIAVSRIIDTGAAHIVSNSYGDLGEDLPLNVLQGENNILIQAAGEGIGMYYSSGDDGDTAAETGYPTPSYIASSPWATAVGGTSQEIGVSGTLLAQTGWGTTADPIVDNAYSLPLPGQFIFGAGGGASTKFAEPQYQKGIVPTALADSADGTPSRVVPDIADLADPETGFQIAVSPVTSYSPLKTGPLEYDTYGGTSLAAPIAAAKIALIQQGTDQVIGFANPWIYATDRTTPGNFHDVVPPATVQDESTQHPDGKKTLIVFDHDTTLSTAKKYDDVTGVGTLNVPAMVANLQTRLI